MLTDRSSLIRTDGRAAWSVTVSERPRPRGADAEAARYRRTEAKKIGRAVRQPGNPGHSIHVLSSLNATRYLSSSRLTSTHLCRAVQSSTPVQSTGPLHDDGAGRRLWTMDGYINRPARCPSANGATAATRSGEPRERV